MVIYKLLLRTLSFLFNQNRNQRQNNHSHVATELSEYNRLLHRLNCITLDDDESKCMHAHLTNILEARNQAQASDEKSGCIVLSMSEEELQKFGGYVEQNTSHLFRAIVDGNNHQERKLRIIGNHGLSLFNVIVKGSDHSQQNQEYIEKDGSRFPIQVEAILPLLECIRQLMSVDTVTVLLPRENRQELAVFATIGLEEEIAKGITIPLGSGFAGKIAASGEQMIVEDLSKIEVVSPILRNSGIHSMLGVPILLKEQVNGVFHVGTFRFRQFTHDDVQQIQFVAAQISLVMQIILKYPKVTSPNKAHFGLNAILNGSFVSALM